MTRIEFLQNILGGGLLPTIPSGPSGNFAARSIVEPDEPEWLAEWNSRPAFPLTGSDDPTLAYLADSVRGGTRIEFGYAGGSRPGERREVTPILLFVRPRPSDLEKWLRDEYEYRVFEGKPNRDIDPVEPLGPVPFDFEELAKWTITRYPVHLSAWCHEKEASRCFRVDRMRIAEEVRTSRLADESPRMSLS